MAKKESGKDKKTSKFYLLFECGGRYPKEGYLKESFCKQAGEAGGKPRKKDGRFNLCVWCTPKQPNGRPIMPDGSFAPCGWCKNTRANGRKKDRCFPSDPERMKILDAKEHSANEDWDWTVTCFPQEMNDR